MANNDLFVYLAIKKDENAMKAIPLKLLDVDAAEQRIRYNVLLRGHRDRPRRAGIVSAILGRGQLKDVVSGRSVDMKTMLDIADNDTWTDFWDSYTLAEKPD